jgi:signal transduction histidine kinase
MNANLIETGTPEGTSSPDSDCLQWHTAELAHVNESIRRRERLLAASAKASRLLLEAPDVMEVVPDVLRLLGEAAGVDRVNLMLAQKGPQGEPLLVVASEWVAEGVVPHLGHPTMGVHDERNFSRECAELRAGRSVCISREATDGCGCVLEGVGTKSKAIVPIFVDGEYVGAVGFDNTRQRRPVDSAELNALETAAGVIGAALHRERLVDAVRREKERAAEQRVAELARANAAIRGNLERLANEPDLPRFLGHVLLEATRQLEAAAGAVIVLDEESEEWRVVAHVENGRIGAPQFGTTVPCSQAGFTQALRTAREPIYLDFSREEDQQRCWPSWLEHNRRAGYITAFISPLVFGGRTIGCISLKFRRKNPINLENNELLIALTQQATLAIELTRRADSAKAAAVLMERNRIGQEIHDGLAQAFTGILMQLGAAEELNAFKAGSPLTVVMNRIRELAKDGLAEARRSVLALRPDHKRHGGLEQALRQLAERSTVSGRVVCVFEGKGSEMRLRPEHEHELFRIAQEAVSNAVRHAEPSVVRIEMTEEPMHWLLAVTDDGVGMKQRPELYAQQGFGLTNMRERACAIGGEWHIESKPGVGTRVIVKVPKRQALQ